MYEGSIDGCNEGRMEEKIDGAFVGNLLGEKKGVNDGSFVG